MNEEVTSIRAAIPSYAGHGDQIARRLSDQQVRAWAGERLATLRERIPVDAAGSAFDDVLLYCQFGDQHVIKALEDGRFGDATLIKSVEAEDARVIAAVAASERVDVAGLPAFLTALKAAFDHRSAAIVALGPTSMR